MRRAALLAVVTCSCHAASTPPPSPPRAVPELQRLERTIEPIAGPRLPLAVTRSFAELRDGVWIADALFVAGPGGVIVFTSTEDAPTVLGPSEGLPSPSVVRVARVGEELWAATDRGIARIDPARRAVIGVLLASERVLAITADGIAVTRRGLVRAHDGSSWWPHDDALDAIRCGDRTVVVTRDGAFSLHATRVDRVRGLPAVPPTRLACHGDDVLAATVLGLYVIHERAELVVSGQITAVGADSFAALDHGVSALAPPRRWLRGSRTAFIAEDGERRAAFVDRTLWIGRGDAAPSGRSFPGPVGLVTAIAPVGDELWIGTFDDGLYRLGRDGYTTHDLPETRISALLATDRALLAGTATGLYVVDDRGRRPLGSSDDWLRRYIGALRPVGDRVEVGAFPGLVELDARTLAVTRRLSGKGDEAGTPGTPALFGTAVNGATTADGGLWLATLEGLQRVDASGTHVFGAIDAALPDDWVNDALATKDGVWFLLGDRGLGRIDRDGTVRIWRAALPSQAGSLIEVGGQIAFLADGALFVARPRDDREIDLVRFGTAEGMPVLVTALALDPRGRLWIAGDGGVVRLDDAARVLDLATVVAPPVLAEVR
jgi:ligand-binding sensor domain-containing protein